MNPSKEQITDLLETIDIPQYGKSIVDLEYIKDIVINKDKTTIHLEIPTSARHLQKSLPDKITSLLLAKASLQAEVKMGFKIESDNTLQSGLSQVKNTIAVFSGKGGVGKSTITANLARAMAKKGYRVGIMDTDIYGPSMCLLFNAYEKPTVTEDRKLIPVERESIKIISMDMLNDKESAIIWRGPMASQMVQNFLAHVLWGSLDYLFIDMPPGTGDIPLTLTQSTQITGSIIVTTPQMMSLADAIKGLKMFQTVSVPILGIVENMSYFICDKCDKKHYPFQKGGGKKIKEISSIPIAAELPFESFVSSQSDQGKSIFAKESLISKAFEKLASFVVKKTSDKKTTRKPYQYTWEELSYYE